MFVIRLYTLQSILNFRNWGGVISSVSWESFAEGALTRVLASDGGAPGVENRLACRSIAITSPRILIPMSLRVSLVKSGNSCSVILLFMNRFEY